MKIKNSRLIENDGRMAKWTKSPNQSGEIGTDGKPEALVIHYTAGGRASGTVKYFKKSAAKASAHLVIGRSGSITQMVKFDTVAWHAGKSHWRGRKGLNQYSIGIELANYGKLTRTDSGDWVSWSGQTVPSSRVIVAEHKHFPGKEYGWEIYDTAQIEATVDAAKAIVSEYSIDPWDVIGHDDISIHRKVDPGPLFGMDKFRSMVFGRQEDSWNDTLYQVYSASGLNLRTGPSMDARLIENLPDSTRVNVVDKTGSWWLVSKIVGGNDDVTGFVHRNWLMPAS